MEKILKGAERGVHGGIWSSINAGFLLGNAVSSTLDVRFYTPHESYSLLTKKVPAGDFIFCHLGI